jgi:hypothetical protein
VRDGYGVIEPGWNGTELPSSSGEHTAGGGGGARIWWLYTFSNMEPYICVCEELSEELSEEMKCVRLFVEN